MSYDDAYAKTHSVEEHVVPVKSPLIECLLESKGEHDQARVADEAIRWKSADAKDPDRDINLQGQ